MYLCYLCNQARELSEALGIPLSCILPVKNYSEELDLDQDTDTLLFGAVQHMLNFADNFFENQAEIQEGNDQWSDGALQIQWYFPPWLSRTQRTSDYLKSKTYKHPKPFQFRPFQNDQLIRFSKRVATNDLKVKPLYCGQTETIFVSWVKQ